jgi:hypothetical protein
VNTAIVRYNPGDGDSHEGLSPQGIHITDPATQCPGSRLLSNATYNEGLLPAVLPN